MLTDSKSRTEDVVLETPSPSVEKKPPTQSTSATNSADQAERRQKLARIQARVQAILLPVAFIAGFLLLWEAWAQSTRASLPGPIQTVRESWQFIAHPFFDNGANDKGLGWQILASLSRVAKGYGLAALVGIFGGILIGKVKALHQGFDPLMQVFRTIPPLAWLPISLAIFNQAEPASIWVIFATSIWPILINTSVGVQRIPQDYENVASVYNIRGFRYLYLVLMPATAPYIFTGLRIAIGMAWLAIVASEMLTGGVGIGFFIWDAWNSGRLPDIVIAVIYVGLVGLVLDRMVALVARFFGTKQD